MKNIYHSKIGDLTIDGSTILIKKYRKRYFIFGDKVIISEKQIPFSDIASVEVETVGAGIGRITFNIKGHNLKAIDIVGFQNAFEFNVEELKDYQGLKTELDKKIQ